MKGFEDRLELVQDFSNTLAHQVSTPSLLITLEHLEAQQHQCPSIEPVKSLMLEAFPELSQMYPQALQPNWQTLDQSAYKLAQLLSLFAPTTIPWELVDLTTQSLNWTEQKVDDARLELCDRQILQLTDEGYYEMHRPTRELLQIKLAESGQIHRFKKAFTDAIILFTKKSLQTPIDDQNRSIAIGVSHVAEVAREMPEYLEDTDLDLPFTCLGNFYMDQGLHTPAGTWYETCLTVVQNRFGKDHPTVAVSLNNLAYYYQSQGRYAKAEPLYLRSLEINQQLAETNLNVAISLNNLAGLYKAQGYYAKAEPIYVQALEQKRRLFGDGHPSVATALSNLASLYYAQRRYTEAESLYKRALKIRKCSFGEAHSSVPTNLNNLAGVYYAQGYYTEAKSLYAQALTLNTQILGGSHPNTIAFQQNLQQVSWQEATLATSQSSVLKQLAEKAALGTRRLLKFSH